MIRQGGQCRHKREPLLIELLVIGSRCGNYMSIIKSRPSVYDESIACYILIFCRACFPIVNAAIFNLIAIYIGMALVRFDILTVV